MRIIKVTSYVPDTRIKFLDSFSEGEVWLTYYERGTWEISGWVDRAEIAALLFGRGD